MRLARMHRTLAASVAAMLVLLTVTAPVGAITDGTADGTGHPYAGFVAFYTGAESSPTFIRRCSGFLVSATVFVTAGHCGRPSGGGTPVGFARVWADESVGGDPATGEFELTDSVVGDSFSLYPGNDIGVVKLGDTGIPLDAYATLPAIGAIDALPDKAPLDIVGYGYSDRSHVSGPPVGRWSGGADRLVASVSFSPASNKKADDLLIHSNGSVGTGGGACYGDSGGPILAAGTSTVLAYNAYVSDANCSGIAYGVRLDVASRLDFVKSFMP